MYKEKIKTIGYGYGFACVGILWIILFFIFGYEEKDEITETSLSKSQQETILTYLNEYKIDELRFSRGIFYYSVQIKKIEHYRSYSNPDLRAAYVPDNCASFDAFDVIKNKAAQGGFSLRTYGLERKCISSESLVNYIISVIDKANLLYTEDAGNEQQLNKNENSYTTDKRKGGQSAIAK